VHIFGEDAAELLHIGRAVFRLKGKITYFLNTAFNEPALGGILQSRGVQRFKAPHWIVCRSCSDSPRVV
jgi:hypothetical protein